MVCQEFQQNQFYRMLGRTSSKSSDCLASQHGFVQERDKKDHTLGILQQGGECFVVSATGKSCRFFEANMEFRSQESMGFAPRFFSWSKEFTPRHVKKFIRPPSGNTQEKVVAARSACHNEDR